VILLKMKTVIQQACWRI